MSFVKYVGDDGNLHVVNTENVIEVMFIHRNVNVREEIVLTYATGKEVRMPKRMRSTIAQAVGLIPDDFLTAGELAERAALREAAKLEV